VNQISKAELMILIAGISKVWETVNKDYEGFDPLLDERLEKIFGEAFGEDGKLIDEKLNEELNKDKTFADLMHEVLSIYEGVYL
jgi:hypothetical protein